MRDTDAITGLEIEKILTELEDESSPRYDTLCEVVCRTTAPLIRNRCRTSAVLRGRGLEGDLLNEICCRAIVKSAIYFFYREEGKVNDDPAAFRKWLLALARNLISDYEQSIGKKDAKKATAVRGEDGEETDPVDLIPAPETDNSEETERIRAAIAIVLADDSQIYKTLTWLALTVLMLTGAESRIEASRELADKYSDLTLYQLFGVIRRESERIPWLRLTQRQCRHIKELLDREYPGGGTYGDAVYSAFFMKKGARATVSDWFNRISAKVRRADGGSGWNI